MSYQIQLTNGNILTTIPDTQLVTTFGGLTLIGKDAVGFGTALNNDLVHMVEHFANNTPPTNPLNGQIWYDSISNAINFWNGTQWQTVGIITSSATAPLDPQEGDEWYDTVNEQLNIWNGFEWVLIGPPNQGGANEGFVVASLPTSTGNVFYLQLFANNQLMGIVSSVEIDNSGIVGFGNIRPGFNFVTNPQSAPSIVQTGIYNPSELTIGDSDQTAIFNDGFDNTFIETNGDPVIVASNGNTAALAAAAAAPVTGTVFFNNINANNYENLPTTVVPGSGGEVIYNGGAGNLAATSLLTIDPASANVRVHYLTCNNQITCGTIYATNYENIPGVSVPGSNGQFIYNNGGNFGATAALTIAGTTITASALTVTNATTLDGTLSVNQRTTITDSLSLTGSVTAASVTANGLVTTNNLLADNNVTVENNLNVDGSTTTQTLTVNAAAFVGSTLEAGDTTVTSVNSSGNVTANELTVNSAATMKGAVTFNTASNAFTLPTNNGSINGGALLTNGSGATSWGTVNLAAWTNSLGTNGYQELPGGLIIQWMTGATSLPATTREVFSETWPIPFPNNCFHVQTTVLLDNAVSTNYDGYAIYVQPGNNRTTVSMFGDVGADGVGDTTHRVFMFGIGN